MKKPKIHSQVGLHLLLAFIVSSLAALLCFWTGQSLIRNQQIDYLQQLHKTPIQQASKIQELLQAYNILPVLNVLIAWAIFGSILFCLLHKRLRYLQTLAKETSRLPENRDVPQTADELYALSDYINHMHARIELLERQALQQQKQRKAMLSYLSTRLRTPLKLIQSGITIAKNDPEHAEKTLAVTQKHVLDMTNLVEQLFEYTYLQDHPESVATTPIDLVLFTRQQLNEWHHLFTDQGRTLEFPHVFQQCKVNAQTELLSDLFRQLLNNALRYAQGSVCIGIQEEKHMLYFENTFTGNAPQIEYLFEHDHFHRGGLELPISKLLANKMAARIEAQVQGQYFRICIYFQKA